MEKQVITYDKWIVTYKQYKETLFEKKMISKKSIIKYQNRVIKNKELGQKKYEIWNRMVWNEFEYINIKNYNFLIDQKSKLQNKIIFSEKKEQIAKQLYDKVKKQLDEHIKNVFGIISSFLLFITFIYNSGKLSSLKLTLYCKCVKRLCRSYFLARRN